MISVLPERRNPTCLRPGSEGGTPEYTALMVSTFYTRFDTKGNTVTNRNTLRLELNSQGRKSLRVNACRGLKLAKLKSAALARKSERINSGKGAAVHGRPGEVEKLTLIRLASKTMDYGHGTYPSFGIVRP